MKYRFRVTQQHIDNASSTALHCPIAACITENMATVKAWVANYSVYDLNTSRKLGQLGWRCRRFIRRFDAGKKVRPFSFTLKEIV